MNINTNYTNIHRKTHPDNSIEKTGNGSVFNRFYTNFYFYNNTKKNNLIAMRSDVFRFTKETHTEFISITIFIRNTYEQILRLNYIDKHINTYRRI